MRREVKAVRQRLARLAGKLHGSAQGAVPLTTLEWVRLAPQLMNEIEPDDALVDYLVHNPDVTAVNRLPVDSPAVRALRDAGVALVVPLVSQGELIGLLNLGPRRSEQGYSSHDRRLLGTLSSQAATALRVAQLAQQERIEALERQRMAHELRMAGSIQQMLLPQQLPDLEGWDTAAHYQPARAVGGDFYDFIQAPDGRLVIVVADVSDKGIPAALVMASTRAIVRAAASTLTDPAAILARANAELAPDVPASMFVTAFCGILDPAIGRLQYANAGHTLPYRRTCEQVDYLRATGIPLGMFPDATYETLETTIEPGECLLFLSDGLTEAHNPAGAMFGEGPLSDALLGQRSGQALLDHLLHELADFTGPGWEQEDDVTLLTLLRLAPDAPPDAGDPFPREADWATLADFSLPSEPGNERRAMELVSQIVQPLGLTPARLDHLKTAVAEATLNAIEHGNQYQRDVPVQVAVRLAGQALAVRVTDRGANVTRPAAPEPDLAAKLAGEQSPRGWGLFLIRSMTDGLRVSESQGRHTIEMLFRLDSARLPESAGEPERATDGT